MALNIKNPEVEQLAADIARVTGESKTEVIRQALLDRKTRMGLPSVEERVKTLMEGLERDVWSKLPPEVRGKRIPKEEYDALFE
ncbi:MAG: type II toxin-antitoxin system VapB family antitoxin [Fimbriimonas sp.]